MTHNHLSNTITDFEATTPKYSKIGKDFTIMNTIKNTQLFEIYGQTIKWKDEHGKDVQSSETSSYFTFNTNQGMLSTVDFLYHIS